MSAGEPLIVIDSASPVPPFEQLRPSSPGRSRHKLAVGSRLPTSPPGGRPRPGRQHRRAGLREGARHRDPRPPARRVRGRREDPEQAPRRAPSYAPVIAAVWHHTNEPSASSGRPCHTLRSRHSRREQVRYGTARPGSPPNVLRPGEVGRQRGLAAGCHGQFVVLDLPGGIMGPQLLNADRRGRVDDDQRFTGRSSGPALIAGRPSPRRRMRTPATVRGPAPATHPPHGDASAVPDCSHGRHDLQRRQCGQDADRRYREQRTGRQADLPVSQHTGQAERRFSQRPGVDRGRAINGWARSDWPGHSRSWRSAPW